MNDSMPDDKRAIARLLQAAVPPGARPDTAVRARVLARVVALQQERLQAKAFPDRLVAVFALAVAAGAGWVLAQLTAPPTGVPEVVVRGLALFVAANVLTVPVAAALVVLKRTVTPRAAAERSSR